MANFSCIFIGRGTLPRFVRANRELDVNQGGTPSNPRYAGTWQWWESSQWNGALPPDVSLNNSFDASSASAILESSGWWIYPGYGGGECNARHGYRYYKSAQPMRAGYFNIQVPTEPPDVSEYYSSPPSLSLPWRQAQITKLAFTFGNCAWNSAAPLLLGNPYPGWLDPSGWKIQIISYCHTDNSGSMPVVADSSSSYIYLPSTTNIDTPIQCGCVDVVPPLDVYCDPGGLYGVRNTISIRIWPRVRVSTPNYPSRIPKHDGFLSIALKYLIKKV